MVRGSKSDTIHTFSLRENPVTNTCTFVDGVEKLCHITSDFSRVKDRELKKAYKPRPWHKRHGELYYILEHNIKATIGPADMKFQLWFKGRRYEEDDQSLALQWVEDNTSDRELRRRKLERIRGVKSHARDAR
jgi:hypothetical protein